MAFLTAHRGEAGNLVPQTLRLDDGDLLHHTLVGVEVLGQATVVLFDDNTGSLLHGLSSDTSLSNHVRCTP